MSSARAILGYAALVIVAGTFLAPWVYQLTQHYLPNVPFRRVFNRTLMGVALLGLWPLLRRLEIRSWSAVGFHPRPEWWKSVSGGVAVGVLSFGVGGALLIFFGTRALATGPVYWLGAVLTAIAVSLVEETFFRGALYGGLRRDLPVWGAILASSVIYSALHFIKAKPGELPINWLTGFAYWGYVLRGFLEQPGVALGFVTLVLVGILLALAFNRTGALYLSIGLHAGWVLALKLFSQLTDSAGGRQWWGGSSLVDNMLMWPILILTGVVIWRWPQRS